MRIFKNLSIRTKLIFLATISGCVAILLTSAAFVLNDINVMSKQKVRQTKLLIDMMQFSDESLERTENDEREARRAEFLSLRLKDYLTRFPTITLGCLYDIKGRPIADYYRDKHDDRTPPVLQEFGATIGEASELELFHPVYRAGEHVATLYIHDDNADVRSHLVGYLEIAMYVTIFSCLVSLLLSIRLQSAIARPIRQLSDAARAIRTDENYSLRVPVSGNNEIATLYRSFNQMVERMDASEQEVRDARDEFENRVAERTSQLRMEIAERKKIEADLVRARDSALESNKSKSHFLANMSHEIRTPLNAILGFSELLTKGIVADDEERNSFLATIMSSGHHLLDLINGILDLSKIDSGQMEMERRRFSPDHVIASALSVMSVKAAEKGLELTYSWFTGVPETIENDEARMRQALINLIGNAIKFTEVGGVHVSCQLVVDHVPAMLEVSVRDTGIGIPPEKLDAVLEPFVQADASVTRKFGGTGLGLAITKRITELLGGELRLTSIEGEGSVFTITMTTGQLDGVPIRSEPVARIETADSLDEMERTDLTGVRILIVEDGSANRKLIRIILSRAGADIDEAENGLLGIQQAMTTAYDLVLMDMQMPVMDGYEATRRLRESGYKAPIIALTANAMKGDQEKCLAIGCSDYLSKPIDTNEVLITVRTAAGRDIGGRPDSAPLVPEPPPISSAATTDSDEWSVPDEIFGHTQPDELPLNSTQVLHLEWPASNDESVTPVPGAGSVQTSIAPPATSDLIVSQLPMDDEDFREIVIEFIDRLDDQMQQLHNAAAADDLGTIEKVAHMIKGSGGSAGFPAFTNPANQLMLLARSGESSGVDALIDELGSLVSRLDRPDTPATS
jgi:signal transduction histidine kinase/HPt (histidine-containing phosphotransfer) domain-containing protein/ActR/RegA family two-component response regulator